MFLSDENIKRFLPYIWGCLGWILGFVGWNIEFHGYFALIFVLAVWFILPNRKSVFLFILFYYIGETKELFVGIAQPITAAGYYFQEQSCRDGSVKYNN